MGLTKYKNVLSSLDLSPFLLFIKTGNMPGLLSGLTVKVKLALPLSSVSTALADENVKAGDLSMLMRDLAVDLTDIEPLEPIFTGAVMSNNSIGN